MSEFIFEPKCFIIHADFDNIDMNELVNEIIQIGNLSFQPETVSIFLKRSKTERDLRQSIQNSGIEDFYLEKVKPEKCLSQTSVFEVWYKENYEAQLCEAIEDQRQETLVKINENIEKILKNKEKEVSTNGGEQT